jgi:hypothetical protein
MTHSLGAEEQRAMWKPSKLGEVIAERRLVARVRHHRSSGVVVRFGRPVQSPVKGDPWWCPVEITGLGKPRFFAAAGEDSLQALIIAMRAADVKLAEFGGGEKVAWLGDKERPIFFHTHLIDMYQGAIDNLLAGLRKAIDVIEGAPDARQWIRTVAEIHRLERNHGFRGRRRPAKRAH